MSTEILALTELQGLDQDRTDYNEALRQIEGRLVRVLSRTTAAQPQPPAEGSTYIIPPGASGADWAAYAIGDLAHYYAGAWHNWTPVEGTRLWVNDEDRVYAYNGTDWVALPLHLADGQVGMRQLAEFSQNPTWTRGLRFAMRGGRVRNDTAVTEIGAGAIDLADSATNYIELTPAGSVTVNQTSFTPGRIPLYTVATSAGAVRAVTDCRTWVSAAAAASGARFSDFDEDPATTLGLVWGYRAGILRNMTAITLVSAGTLQIYPSAINYVEVNREGKVCVNKGGFTAGHIPLRRITTNTEAITDSLDQRAALVLSLDDFKSDGSIPMTGDLRMQRNAIKAYAETLAKPKIFGGALKIILSVANVFAVTLTADVKNLTFESAPDAGKAGSFTLILTQDETGGRGISWPKAVKWPGGTAPAIGSAAGSDTVLTFVTIDGGVTWRGFLAGKDFA